MPQVEEPNDPNEKVREQIEEILAKDERRTVTPIRVARPVTRRKVRTSTPVWYPTPEKLIAVGVVLMLIAVIGRRFVLPLTLAGFALAGIGYYLIVMRKRRARYGYSSSGSTNNETKYWRGKPVKPARLSAPVKKRDGNILEFPDPPQAKKRGRFGRKR